MYVPTHICMYVHFHVYMNIYCIYSYRCNHIYTRKHMRSRPLCLSLHSHMHSLSVYFGPFLQHICQLRWRQVYADLLQCSSAVGLSSHGVLQCAAVCCSVLQCAAACCSMLQCAAVCCSVSKNVAVWFSLLHCVVVFIRAGLLKPWCVSMCCSVLQ